MQRVLKFFSVTAIFYLSMGFSMAHQLTENDIGGAAAAPFAQNKVDPAATALAPWAVGEKVISSSSLCYVPKNGRAPPCHVHRRFLGVTQEGFYLVQDFYSRTIEPKYTNPYLFQNQTDVMQDNFIPLLAMLAPAPEFFDRANHKITGPYTRWYASGALMEAGEYLNGQRQGIWRTWLESGDKRSEGQYLNGQKQGLWTGSWNNTTPKEYEGAYINDERDGHWVEWHTNGLKRLEADYINGQQQGLVTKWWVNGNKYQQYTYENGQPHGVWTEWHSNEQKFYTNTYQNGKIQGLSTMWHDNGEKSSEGFYKDDTRVGVWQYWDKRGRPTEQRDYGPEGL